MPDDWWRGALALYRVLATAREIDRREAELVSRGEAFFHVSGAGHEASAALAAHLTPHDWLHCHYRDKALLLARGVPPGQFFMSLLCRDGSHSRGRQMSAHLSDRTLNILSVVGPVGNNALQAVGVAAEVRHGAGAPIVVCSVGDGTTQQGEFLEAVAEAVRESLPVLFLIHDNRWAISTATAGQTFFSRPDGPAREFYGLPIRRVDGRDPLATGQAFGEVVAAMRAVRGPAIVWLDVERLCDHTNADDQTLYRDPTEIAAALRDADPLVVLRRQLIAAQYPPDDAREAEQILDSLEADVAREVAEAVEHARRCGDPAPLFTAKAPLPACDVSQGSWGDLPRSSSYGHPSSPSSWGDLPRSSSYGHPSSPSSWGDLPRSSSYDQPSSPSSWGDLPWSPVNQAPPTMREALCETLRHHLRTNPRVSLLGQDIADPKGDVFGVTRGLSGEFPGRVRNAPLSEATIVGTSIGRALAGARPVAFLQFADFLPLAYNQILSELGSMHWRTDGAWQAPVIVMIACGGYRPGLGPFHAQTLESIAVHAPGVDVVMPSTAANAAALLDAAFASGRPTLCFYPKARLNHAEATTAAADHRPASLGRARLVRAGDDLTLVAWGNTVELCQRAAASLEEIGVSADLIDLCSLSPWDEAAVVASAEKTRRLVIVHEDNRTCGFGAEVAATVAERAAWQVRIRRVTRADTFVPCHFGNQLEVLPSYRRVLAAACDLLAIELTWRDEAVEADGCYTIDAIGSGPADEAILVSDLLVSPGDRVQVGDVVAVAEAAKSAVDVCSTVAGVVAEVCAVPGETVPVGRPLMRIRTDDHLAPVIRKPVAREPAGAPIFRCSKTRFAGGGGGQPQWQRPRRLVGRPA